MGWDRTTVRNLAGFWLLGLCNNYGYVIMLSAAEDIMNTEKNITSSNSTDTCQVTITDRDCQTASTGSVLVADNLPALIVQATFPFFMHRIPFGVRHTIVILLQMACYFMVAFSSTVGMSLAGVTFASFAQGIGEITYLAMSAFFPPLAVAAWSSGTGGAGVLGSFVYALLTEVVTPKTALLIMLFIPVLFAITYWVILDFPESVYTPTLTKPATWIVPSDYYKKAHAQQNEALENESQKYTSIDQTSMKSGASEVSAISAASEIEGIQRSLTFFEKLKLILPMLHLMIPLTLVYLTEYLINQGLTELIYFNCHDGWKLSTSSQYRWYQVLYQVGVFISRSSVRFMELPIWAIYLLPVVQTLNMVFFIFEAIYWFIPNIGIVFAIIVLEGLLGGGAYVNTYNYAHKTVSPDVREYSMSVIAFGVSVGTTISGFVAIPLHNFVCTKPTPHAYAFTPLIGRRFRLVSTEETDLPQKDDEPAAAVASTGTVSSATATRNVLQRRLQQRWNEDRLRECLGARRLLPIQGTEDRYSLKPAPTT